MNIEEVFKINIENLSVIDQAFLGYQSVDSAGTHQPQNEKRARELYQLISDQVNDTILVMDLEGTLIEMNSTATRMYGYSREELLAMRVHNLREPICISEVDEQMRKADDGQILFETLHQRKDGTAFPVEVSSKGAVIGNQRVLISIVRDITERKKAEQEMIKMQELTLRAEKMASLGAMAAGIAHEVNQPLNSLKIIADSMIYWHKKGKHLDMEKVIGNLHKISDQAERIDKIVRHMRSFVHKGHMSNAEQCNLNDIVGSVMELLASQLSSHGIIVVKRLDESLPMIYGEKIRLEEVLINLLVNGMQALDISGKGEKRLIIETLHQEKIVLKISDNGTGIKEEIWDTIFDPFFTTKGVGEGMGIGLTIAHSVITSLRGQIEVTNNDMGGATFIITLPVDRRKV